MASQVIVSRSSTSTITLILPLYSSKEPTFTTFHYPFRYKVYTLLPINSHTQHDVFEGVQSSSGALKRLALKSKSETFSCVLLTNSHTRRDAFEETDPPAVLSSIHSPILGRV